MRFAADENFNEAMLKGLETRIPDLDVVRVRDTEMFQSSDPELLTWVANEGRILLTHDVNTMRGYVFERVQSMLPVPGVIVVKWGTPIGKAIDELEILIRASTPDEFENQVKFVPLT